MRPKTQRGFTVIETLIALALIGVVAVGVIPLFTRAISDNLAGADYTRVTNYAKSKEEDFGRLPFTQPTIQVQPGTTRLLLPTEYMDPTTLKWTTTRPSNPLAIWTRNTAVTQYSIFDTDDDNTFNQPLDGNAPVDEVQILQGQVQVKSASAIGPMGARRTTIIRFLKAF